jgi:hypothetical protein
VRSYMVAGAVAISAGALAAVPALVAPQDVPMPDIKIPVALAASPLDFITQAVFSTQTLAAGSQDSVRTAFNLYSADVALLAHMTAGQVSDAIHQPSTIITTITQIPTDLEYFAELGEQQTVGINATGITPDHTYSLPGETSTRTWVPIPGVPQAEWPVSETVDAGYHGAVAAIAEAVDEQTGTTTFGAIVRAGNAMEYSIFQAQGLVRSATLGAIQDTVDAAISGGDVPGAVTSGVQSIQKSIFGDPDVPKVTPGPAAPGSAVVGNVGVHTGTATDTVEPVKRLGAIKTITSTAQTQVANVAHSLGQQSPATKQSAPKQLAAKPAAKQSAPKQSAPKPSATKQLAPKRTATKHTATK